MKKRMFALFLSFVLLIGMIPVTVNAASYPPILYQSLPDADGNYTFWIGFVDVEDGVVDMDMIRRLSPTDSPDEDSPYDPFVEEKVCFKKNSSGMYIVWIAESVTFLGIEDVESGDDAEVKTIRVAYGNLLTVDPDGGEWDAPADFIETDGVYSCIVNGSIDLTGVESPTKRGFRFMGWSYALDDDDNLILTAQWEEVVTVGISFGMFPLRIIRFHENGGSTVKDVKTLFSRVYDLTLPDYTPVREGYTFTGWYFDKALTKPAGAFLLKTSYNVYAGWEEILPEVEETEDTSADLTETPEA